MKMGKEKKKKKREAIIAKIWC